jgi:hypothetical protein
VSCRGSRAFPPGARTRGSRDYEPRGPVESGPKSRTVDLVPPIRGAVREIARAVLPQVAYRRLIDKRTEQLLKRQSADRIDLSKVHMLRGADPGALVDAERLELELLPALGLNHELLNEHPWPLLPRRLHRAAGTGLLSWQFPNQFSGYLVHLSRYPIARYLEIGVRHGGTFVITVEYLSRFRELELAVGVDICESPSMAEYATLCPRTRFVQTSSRSRRFRRLVEGSAPWDLVLIDGSHHEEAVRRDFEAVRDSARIVAFHDIVSEVVPGVARVWGEVKTDHADRFDFFEFTSQYDEVVRESGRTWLGLGVAVDTSFRPREHP